MPNETNYDINLVGRYHRPYHFNWFSVFAPVVPYVYDGSLSLLEMVHKLLLYINKVNQAVNENHTDIINLAKLVEELAAQCAELPELIARIEELIAMLPPFYTVNIALNGETAELDKSIEEIRNAIEEGKVPVGIVDGSIIAVYDSENETFQFNHNKYFTVIERISSTTGFVVTTATITEHGGTISGFLTLLNNPVNDTDAVNKKYVDDIKTALENYTNDHIEAADEFMAIINSTPFEELKTAYREGKRKFRAKSNGMAAVVYNECILVTYLGELAGIEFVSPIDQYKYTVSEEGWQADKWIMDDYSQTSRLSILPISSKFTIAELDKKQPLLEFDNYPREESDNPVKSKGIKEALDNLEIQIDNIEEYIAEEKLDVIVTRTGLDEYSSTHYAQEINEAYNGKKIIRCVFGSVNYTLANSTNNTAIFTCLSNNGSINIILITANSVTMLNNFAVTSNGTSINNTITTGLFLDYEIEDNNHAVNKEYVDNLIEQIPVKIRVIEYDIENGTCEMTNSEIHDIIAEGVMPIAHGIIGGNESWGYLVTNSSRNLRYVFFRDVGKYTSGLKHETDETISLTDYTFITSKGGGITNNSLNFVDRGRCNIYYTPTDQKHAVNKEYVDTKISENIPVILDVTRLGNNYTLPYSFAQLGLMVIRNPYIAIRWQKSVDNLQILYLHSVNSSINFCNSYYRGNYTEQNIITFTAI